MKTTIGTKHARSRLVGGALLVLAALLLGLASAPYLKLAGSAPDTSAASHETVASQTTAARRLLRINEQWYASPVVVDVAGRNAKRLERLNEEAYPSTADVRAHNPSRLARVNNELYPDDVTTAAMRPTNQERLWRIDQGLNPPEAIPAIRSGRPQ